MKCIFLLSGDYINLGAEEVVSLFDVKDYSLKSRLIIFDFDKLPENKIQRLALTKDIYQFLFECKIDDLIIAFCILFVSCIFLFDLIIFVIL